MIGTHGVAPRRGSGSATREASGAAHLYEDLVALRGSVLRERRAREVAEERLRELTRELGALHRRELSLAARLEQACMETITGFARAVESRDRHTGRHVERTRGYAVEIAEALGVSGTERSHLECGALLHDIGKIGVSDDVLSKPGPLTPHEWALMRSHPQLGAEVLACIEFLRPAVDAVLCHHERWDGGGYPHGMRGAEIPLAGRIVSVADAFDAMTSNRTYQRALPPGEALDEVKRLRGVQFCPEVVDAFLAAHPVLEACTA